VPLSPPKDAVERFRGALVRLIGEEASDTVTLGVAVSGGPDSLALLLLAASALPGRVLAATVDHGLRPESAAEARWAAEVSAERGVTHETLALSWDELPQSNRQAVARNARYLALGRWATEQQLPYVATAHHLDDQAETLLMRMGRGAGVGGLAGIREHRRLKGETDLIRPLLGWRRSELRQVVDACGVAAIADPSNLDAAYDRTRARVFLDAAPDWLDLARLAASAHHLDQADRALEWAAGQLLGERVTYEGAARLLNIKGLPQELVRRLALKQVAALSPTPSAEPRGDVLARAIDTVRDGQVACVAGVVIRPAGTSWRFEREPPRRT